MGSIPAWAGETPGGTGGPGNGGVYPRVGGGNTACRRKRCSTRGLSPRGRGKPRRLLVVLRIHWSIPAWAGETPRRQSRDAVSAVYPRVGGGNAVRICSSRVFFGLSPRGRGKPVQHGGPGSDSRSIPAWAGETWGGWGLGRGGKVYPRVGGGNLAARMAFISMGGLSPRGRGKLGIDITGLVAWRSIPAWAGETCGWAGWSWGCPVYPRVGGGNSHPRNCPLCTSGLSPRGRGKLRRPGGHWH